MPQPTSLTMTGTPQAAADGPDLVQQAGEVAVAARLDGFLQWVEMQDQGVGVHHVNGSPAFVEAVPVVELNSAEVGQEWDCGSQAADLVTGFPAPVLQRRSLGAEAQCNAAGLGCFGQCPVDEGGLIGTPGHG